MKKLLKVLASSMVATTLIASVASCSNKTDDTTTPTTENNGTFTTVPEGSATYKVRVKSLSGMPIKDCIVSTKIDGKYKDYSTDETGYVTFIADKTKSYSLEITAPDGYIAGDDCEGVVAEANGEVEFTLTPTLITGQDQPSSYSEYDQMVDYTFNGYKATPQTTDENNKTVAAKFEEQSMSISDLLDSGKELIILNFWYTTCSWCKTEFPLMFNSYNDYANKDKIQIIGINPGSSSNDTTDTVKTFLAEAGYDFFTTVDDTTLINSVGISGYPTSVFIDRYGTICSIESGAITSEDKWTALYDKYVGDNYTPTYEESGSTVIPTTTFPGSEALSVVLNGVSGTFTTEERDKYKTYNWPWNVSKYNNENVIIPTNSGVNSAYSILYLTVTVPANKALGLDYMVSSEDGDIFGVFVDGKKVFQDAGKQTEYTTKYIYAAGDSDEEITVEFIYSKDSKTALYDDTVYVKNIHFADVSTIGEFRAIRQAAYGELDPVEKTWSNYVTAVYNTTDGYYHVNSENGPLLLAALMDENTHFANDTVASLMAALTDEQKEEHNASGVTYYSIITKYASYCNNSSVTMYDLPTNGLTSITEELHEALVWVAKTLGAETLVNNDKQWLEMCVYIDEYNFTDESKKMGDPIQGLATFSALDAVVNYDTTDKDKIQYNAIKYDFPLVPRGYYWKFTPTKSGVYHLYGTDIALVTDCFLYDEDGNSTGEITSREIYKSISDNASDTSKINENFSYYMYYEAGHTYYCAPCFWDINDTENTLVFRIDYVQSSYQYLAQASSGIFTYEDSSTGSTINQYISIANVKVELGTDNYYHPVVNGEIQNDQYIYADFKYVTGIFNSTSLEQLSTTYKTVTENKEEKQVTVFNFAYDENFNKLSETELAAWCLDGQDRTEEIKTYIREKMDTDTNSVTYGTVKVDATLQNILQQLMNKCTFVNVVKNSDGTTSYSPVDGSWLKLCYYMVTLGE